MALTAEQTERIRASFMELSRDLPLAGEVFYDRLFAIAPETRALFVTDMADQGAKLMSTISIVVSQLHMRSSLQPLLAELAIRHLAYGVCRVHYEQVGAALDEMLSIVLADRYGEDDREAWMTAYDEIAGTMISAAYGSFADPPR